MATQPPDYFGAMGGAQNMVDPSGAVARGLMNQLQPQTLAIQNQGAAQQLQMQRIALQRQLSFGDDMKAYLAHPSAEGVAALFGKYPEFGTQLKDAYGALDAQRQRTDATQIGSIASLTAKGDYQGAADLLKTRIDADKAAGHDASTDQAMYDHLTSNDPAQQKAALGMLTIALGAAVGPDHAADFLKANGFDKAPVAVGLDQRLVNPSTGEVLTPGSPELKVVTNPVTGESTVVNPLTGKFGAAAVDGSSDVPAGSSASPSAVSAGTPRADRNNNPGNLRAVNPKTGQAVSWVTHLPGYQGADAQGYAIFAPGTSGQQGQQALLGRYFAQGRNTVSSIVEHWAPRQSAGGDNTDAQVNNYISYVAHQLGVDPNKPLPEAAIPQLAAAMHRFESGATGRAGSVRVPPEQQAVTPNPAATSDAYHFGGAGLNTKEAPAGYAWNATHTGVEPIPGGEQDVGSYPPAMLHDAAVELLTTGQMPSFGMGGGAIKKAILDERSKIMQQAGITADQLPTFRARYGADKAALQNISGIESGLKASEAALKPYMDQVLAAQTKLHDLQILDNGLPEGNAARLALYSRVGSQETKSAIKQYRDAINALTTEYGKFMSSASGMSNTPTTDSARKLAGELTDETLGPAAMKAHMEQLQREASIKMNSVTNQRQALENRLSSYLKPNGAGNAVQVRTVQQYNALPKGARYIDPNGVHRVKR